MNSLDDTIVAVATPPGEGGIAVVRVSGPRAEEMGVGLLRGRSGARCEFTPREVRWAQVVDPLSRCVVDEALAIWMPAPASYTREDVLEIHCHGGQAAARAVMDLLLRQGARLAGPGEFTLRAYLRGRIDLLQAEAVLDTIRSCTADALRVHEGILEGRLSEEIGKWQSALGGALGEMEAHLDFPEEDLEDFQRSRVLRELGCVAASMEDKLRSYSWGRTAREGFLVVLVGSPNTGKSSLLNCLAEEERAIVSAIPGTTRDAIDVRVNALGVPVRVVDTAGLRAPGDQIEAEGVRRARSISAEADLVVLVCDGGRDLLEGEAGEAMILARRGGVVAVVNKRDIGTVPEEQLRKIFGAAPLLVSARTGEGVVGLLEVFREAAWGGRGPSLESPLTRARHREAVGEARECLTRAMEGLAAGDFLEVVASEVQGARRCLKDLVGWGTSEDVLDRIFSEFCIGK